jgi:VanZ family protein
MKIRDALIRWLPLLLWMGVIFFLSSRSNPYLLLPSGVNEKADQTLAQLSRQAGIGHQVVLGEVSHAAAYILLGGLMFRSLRSHWPARRLGVVAAWAAAGSILYALSDETHQLFVPGRAFQLEDLALDLSGILIGLGLFWVWQYARQRWLAKTAAFVILM